MGHSNSRRSVFFLIPLDWEFQTGMVSIGNEDRPIVIAFDVLTILVTLFLLLVIITAAVSRQIQRTAIWFNFMLPVMFYPASFLLLLGSRSTTRLPPPGLCAFQAVLIYSIPVYAAIGFICFTVDFFLILREIFHQIPRSRIVSKFLLVAPAAAFFINVIADTSMILLKDRVKLGDLKPIPNAVGGIYCHTNSGIPFLVAGIATPAGCLWMVVFYKTSMLLRRHRAVMRNYDGWLRKRIFSVFIRTAILAAMTLTSIGFGIFIVVLPAKSESSGSVFVYLMPPYTIALVFGTRSEIFKCWICRRPSGPSPKSDTTGLASM